MFIENIKILKIRIYNTDSYFRFYFNDNKNQEKKFNYNLKTKEIEQ